MNEEMKVMEVMNEEAVVAVVEETTSNSSLLKNVLIGGGIIGLGIGLGIGIKKIVEKRRAKKAEIIEAEAESEENVE